MKITRTITIDGATEEEYQQIKDHLESLKVSFPQWELFYHPLVKQVVAKSEEFVEKL
jgi:cupin superfamily acireductone dioxygenase involved in methionine salvage